MIFKEIIKTILDAKNAIKDMTVIGVSQVFTTLTSIIISIFLARYLGPETLGQYALIISVSGLTSSLSDLGIGQIAIRYASQANSENNKSSFFDILRWAFHLRIAIVTLITTVVYLFSNFIATNVWLQPQLAPLIRYSLLIGVFSAVASIPAVYFQSLRKFGINSAIQIFQSSVKFAGIIILAYHNNWSLINVITVSIVTTGIGSLLLFLLVPSQTYLRSKNRISNKNYIDQIKLFFKIPFVEKPDKTFVKDTPNNFSLNMIISSVIIIITTHADIWLIGYYLNTELIGKFHVAMRFVLPMTFFLNSLTTSIWPRVSISKEPDQINIFFKRVFKLALITIVPFIIYSIISPLLIPFIFGKEYSDIILLTQILCMRFSFSILLVPVSLIGYNIGLASRYTFMNLFNLVLLILFEMYFLNRIGLYAPIIAKAITTFTLVPFLYNPIKIYFKKHVN